MRQAARIGWALAGGAIGVAAGVAGVGALRWRRETAACVDRLVAEALPSPSPVPVAPAGLPPPVARYFAFALPEGAPRVRSARIRHAGEFRMGGVDGKWCPFTSEQHFGSDPPGFVWEAAIRLAPLAAVRVRDHYLHGHGAMEARVFGALPVMRQADRPELDAGALQRYLAEAVWFPTALLPGMGVAWEPIDTDRARATLTDGALQVSLEFTFGQRGEIVRAYAPARYREREGHYVATPWQCRYGGYERLGGMQVPREGEVAWLLPEGPLSYWRGRIREAEYGFGAARGGT